MPASKNRGATPDTPRGDDPFAEAEILAASVRESLESGKALEASLTAAGVPARAARFVAERIDETCSAPDATAWRAAFCCRLLEKHSALSGEVRRLVLRVHRSTQGALSPFVEVEDLHSLVQWRLFHLPAGYFRDGGALRTSGLRGLIATVARRVALDELRRLTRRAQRLEAHEALLPPARDERDQLEIADEIRTAFTDACRGHPEWLCQIALDLLLERSDAEHALNELNERRRRDGSAPWTRNALAQFLSRLRTRMRTYLAE